MQQEQLQTLFEQLSQMSGLVMVVQIASVLVLCWMFRPTIARIIEHLFGLPHTNDNSYKDDTSTSLDKTSRLKSGSITVNVTNVNINNPTNVQINHGSLDVDGVQSRIANDNTEISTPYLKSSLLKRHRKLLFGCLGVALIAWYYSGTQPDNPPEKIATVQTTQTETAELPSSNTPPKIEATVAEPTPIPASEPKKTEPTTSQQPNTTPPIQNPIAMTITRKQLNGRGLSDGGRDEPQYVGVIGYAAVYYSDLDYREGPHDTPWHIKTYEKDKQFWRETGEGLEHKTEIIVKKQWLEHKTHDIYHGYLEVERRSDGKTFYIDVKNFITNPYWKSGDVMSAIKVGKCFATFQQKSDYYPVDINNKKVDMPDGTWVIVEGLTGTYGRGGPDNRTHQVSGLYWREDLNRYGGAAFNIDDLQFQY